MLGESRAEALSVPERVRTLALELGEENVIVILDQNLNYPDGDVLGTDLASTLRQARLGKPVFSPPRMHIRDSDNITNIKRSMAL